MTEPKNHEEPHKKNVKETQLFACHAERGKSNVTERNHAHSVFTAMQVTSVFIHHRNGLWMRLCQTNKTLI